MGFAFPIRFAFRSPRRRRARQGAAALLRRLRLSLPIFALALAIGNCASTGGGWTPPGETRPETKSPGANSATVDAAADAAVNGGVDSPRAPRGHPTTALRAPSAAAADPLPPPASHSANSRRADRPTGRGQAPFRDLHELAPYLEGICSWYGPSFHGKPTANGEIYDQNAMTAAHPILPMGTRIEVLNLRNGRKARVRINDRGPYKKGRILDLSRGAARRIGMLHEGTAPVRITVLHWPPNLQPALGLKAYRQFVVQVAAFPDPFEADRHRRNYQQRFPWARFRVDLPPDHSRYTVISGPYETPRAAERAARRLLRAGVTSLVRSYRK